MSYDTSNIEYDLFDNGVSVGDPVSLSETEMEMADNRSASDSVDYSSYFEDIISDIETLLVYTSEDVNLSDIHHDLVITNFLILFFIVLFCGNKLVNRIRGL